MPHEHLTPLGRQLRSVLATSVLSAPASASASSSRPPPIYIDSFRQLHHSSLRRISAAPATVHSTPTPPECGPGEEQPAQDGRRFRDRPLRILKRRERVDHLTEALKDSGVVAAVRGRPRTQLNLAYVSPLSHHPIQDLIPRQERHRMDPKQIPALSKNLSLQRIVASCIRHQHEPADLLAAEWESTFKLSQIEREFLSFKGVTVEDVRAWAHIVSQRDALVASQALAQRMKSFGPTSIPTFIYMHLLQRPVLTAPALRILVQCAYDLFGHGPRCSDYSGIVNGSIFLVVVRLLSHARRVWPSEMPSIAEFWLQHLRHQEETHRPFDSEQLPAVTFRLNQLMALVSYATSENPYIDNHHQHAAIESILRYMSEHSPPIQINRKGYRAVIRVQLTQRKTRSDQQWAELKALSWPPWKSDRTAMDAIVGLEYGVSPAGATLARMKEAGYRPLGWEKIAHVYAGWDVDRTPTIQMRALLQEPDSHTRQVSSAEFTPWSARIESTRTVQEAWACYLAWEDKKLPPDQLVYLAIFQKLQAEDKRRRTGDLPKHDFDKRPAWPLFPGDTREVSPLPPSTHQHTYTRSLPPRLDDFYNSLSRSGVKFRGKCLAYLIEHAGTIQSAIERLCDNHPKPSHVTSILRLETSAKLTTPVFVSLLGLFARFAKVPMSLAAPEYRNRTRVIQAQNPLSGEQLNLNSPMACAIYMLRSNPVRHLPAWTAILRGLTLARNSYALTTLYSSWDTAKQEGKLSSELVPFDSHIKGHRAFRVIVELLRDRHLNLNAEGFYLLCVSTEKATLAGWSALLRTRNAEEDAATKHRLDNSDSAVLRLRMDAKDIFAKEKLLPRLKAEFRILIGQDPVEDSKPPFKNSEKAEGAPVVHEPAPSDSRLPRLPTTPSPAVLHAYIRALGWLADYDGLLDTILWMRDHESDLSIRRAQHRLGLDMMRKTIIALRVFLERSWFESPDQPLQPPDQPLQSSGRDAQGDAILTHLRTPADPDLVARVKAAVEDVPAWEGWPTDEEVAKYASDERFQQVIT